MIFVSYSCRATTPAGTGRWCCAPIEMIGMLSAYLCRLREAYKSFYVDEIESHGIYLPPTAVLTCILLREAAALSSR